jgi:ATP adenylyltransferase
MSNDQPATLFPPTLWPRTVQVTEQALHSGAIQPIPTTLALVADHDLQFIVRCMDQTAPSSLSAGVNHPPRQPGPNPFLPYEQELFVADLSATHICLLNKFNVVNHHLLMVTRSFVEQTSLLTLEDFTAMWLCLAAFEGLAFFNGGAQAGASQRHKHLQYIPLPLGTIGPKLPIEPALAQAQFDGPVGRSAALPFAHALVKLEPHWIERPEDAAAATLEFYYLLLRAVGWSGALAQDAQQPFPYNLLATRQWLWLIPRRQEHFYDISVNALGFAGSLFARNATQMALIQQHGPLGVLSRVGIGVSVGQ